MVPARTSASFAEECVRERSRRGLSGTPVGVGGGAESAIAHEITRCSEVRLRKGVVIVIVIVIARKTLPS